MVSTFFGLNIAASGLRAANAALNTTGNNISNVNTDGYSRQKVDTSPSDALRTFTRYGSAGAGVDTLAIERVRDQFYDNRYRQNQTLLGDYEMKNYFNKNIETYMKDDGTTGFSALFDKMQAGLQTAIKNSASTSTKMTYVSEVQAMTEYFNTMYTNLQREQADANDELKIRVSKINSIAQELATINGRINLIEMTGTTANELRDKRDIMLDELSKIVSIETRETDIMDVNQPDRKTGATRFEVHIAGGQSLVDAGEYKQLLCVARKAEDAINQTDLTGLYDVKWVRSDYDPDTSEYMGDFDLGNANIGGELGGIIALRDGNNGQDFHGYITDVDYDHRLVTVKVDDFDNGVRDFEEYLKSLDKCTIPAKGQIMADGTKFQYDAWSYREILDDKGNVKSREYTFHFAQSVTDSSTYSTGMPVAYNPPYCTKGYVQIGPDIQYQGIPYYLEQMSEFARLFTGEVNDIMKRGYPADRDEHGSSLLTGTRGQEISESSPFKKKDDGQRVNGAIPQYTDDEIELVQRVATAADMAAASADPQIQKEFDDKKVTEKKSYAEMYADYKAKVEAEGGTDQYKSVEAYFMQMAAQIKGCTYLTAGNFAVSDAIKGNANLLATRLDVTEGIDEMRALSDLYKMCSTKEIFRGATSGEYLDKVLGDISLNASNSQTNEDTFKSLEVTITNQRNSVMGVDEDEEAANLVKYQNSYTLASKMIQTLTEIYDRLINQTGV